jgi:hypothetical protein
MFLAAKAEGRGVELFRLCAYVPTYDFSAGSTVVHRLAMEQDYKAWHDLMRRLNRLFGLRVDLSDLQRQSERITAAWDEQIEQLALKLPQLRVRDYLARVEADFDDEALDSDDDLWESALRDILDDDGARRT